MNLFPTFSTRGKVYLRSDVFLPDKTRFWKICDVLSFLLRQRDAEGTKNFELGTSQSLLAFDDTTTKNESTLSSIINVIYDYQLHNTWILKETSPIRENETEKKERIEKGTSHPTDEVEFCYIRWNRIYVPLSFYSSGFAFFQKWKVEDVMMTQKAVGTQQAPFSIQLVWRIVGKKHPTTYATNQPIREEWWKQLYFIPRVCSVNKKDPLEITIVIRSKNETIVNLGHFWHYLVDNTQIFVEIDSCSVLFVSERKSKKPNSSHMPMSSLSIPLANPFLHVCRFQLQTGQETEYELRKYDFANYHFHLNSFMLVDQEFWLLASPHIFRFETESGCFLSPPFSWNFQESAIQIVLPLNIHLDKQKTKSSQQNKKPEGNNQKKERNDKTWRKEEKSLISTYYLSERDEPRRERRSSVGKEERSVERRTQFHQHQTSKSRRKSVDYRIAANLVFSRSELPTAEKYRYVHTGKELQNEIETEEQESAFDFLD